VPKAKVGPLLRKGLKRKGLRHPDFVAPTSRLSRHPKKISRILVQTDQILVRFFAQISMYLWETKPDLHCAHFPTNQH
jgi:hypothetical protein